PQDTPRPELIKHSYGVSELYAAPSTTRHLLDDASVDIASWLIGGATHDFAETEGESFLRGNGNAGTPRGLLDYGTTNQKDFTRAWGKHQYIPAGHAAAPTDANLVTACINIVAALRKPYKAGATWLMNSTTAARLMGIADENGRRLWAPTGNLIEGVEHPLLGYRVEIDEGMDDISAGAGAHPIAFGDFGQGYVIVDRQGVRINRDEITVKGRVIFDTYKRVGGGAGDFNAIKFIKVAAS
ncbi:MAG: phage major capsid protein, partial [Rhizobiales bacterium]|nr:phage major capsid protein [Hyphomicrobiales bacterium]